jgi:hypothetical protein
MAQRSERQGFGKDEAKAGIGTFLIRAGPIGVDHVPFVFRH